MEDASLPPNESSTYACPGCGEVIAADRDEPGAITCPKCGEPFFLPTDETTDTSDAEQEEPVEESRARAEPEASVEAELSEVRIRQIAGLRGGAIRSRSWFMVGAAGSSLGAVLLVIVAISDFRKGMRHGPAEDLLLAAVAVVLAPYFLRRVRAYDRELRETRLQDPQTPPELSSLSDGSQRWARLDEMSRDSEIDRRAPDSHAQLSDSDRSE